MSSAHNPSVTSLAASRWPLLALFIDALQTISHFETSPTLAIAVSGGADSMGLLLLAHAWEKQNKGRVVALTVDHGLRKESAAEAKQVGRWCKTRGIDHRILKPKRKIAPTQASAREARYDLLTGWCKANHVLHLLTAHHAGDQAETLMFRLGRGSHIEGLASIPAVSTRSGVRLLRPLLAFPKTALEDFLKKQNQPWIEDPTNRTDKYTRNVIRAQLSPKLGEKAATLACRIGVVRNRMEHRLAETMARTISLFPEGYAVMSMPEFVQLPPEYGVRALAALIQTVGGGEMPPRTEKLRRLYADLQNGKTRTLGGCLFRYRPGKRQFMVRRERKAAAEAGFRLAKPLAGQAFLGLNSVG